MRTGKKRTLRDTASRFALVLLLAAVPHLTTGCVERRTPEEPEISGHPGEFADTASPDFHGLRVREGEPSACETCHGPDLKGDAGTPGCYECHNGPGGHPRNWALAGSPVFHGDNVAAEGLAGCRDCHGSDLLGGWTGVSCDACHEGPGGHPEGWTDSDALSFHGRRAFVEGTNGCARCHGYPPSRGTSGVSCADCHA